MYHSVRSRGSCGHQPAPTGSTKQKDQDMATTKKAVKKAPAKKAVKKVAKKAKK